MKLNNIKIVLGLGLAFMLGSCSNSDELLTPNSERVAVKVAADFTSLSSTEEDGNWNANSMVGLTMMDKEEANILLNAFNFNYTTPDGTINFQPISEENTAYFPQDGSEVSIKAYHPYNKELTKDQKLPVTVKDQSNLVAIDYMTAEHLEGFSKTDSAVKLHFKHRMAKLIFNISLDDKNQTIPLKDFKLEMSGMKTTGVYDILAEALAINEESAEDIVVPSNDKDDNREAIVLPREAGEGVSFKFTTEKGDTYVAKMSPELKLEAGYQYTFNIKLQAIPLTVSATVEEWKEGPKSDLIAQ